VGTKDKGVEKEVLLAVPHFVQEQPLSCIPASIRMVLGYLGIEQSELEIGTLIQSDQEGTSVMNIELLTEADWGVTVMTDAPDFQQLKHYLDQGTPVIAAVWTGALPYWTRNRPHAVVIVGYDENEVYLNDPKFANAPQRVTWEDFSKAWEPFGWFAAIIRLKSASAST
jgi:ABC-type bacteriocin/lantibiotic exporter with double-glycine peptidase domain